MDDKGCYSLLSHATSLADVGFANFLQAALRLWCATDARRARHRREEEAHTEGEPHATTMALTRTEETARFTPTTLRQSVHFQDSIPVYAYGFGLAGMPARHTGPPSWGNSKSILTKSEGH